MINDCLPLCAVENNFEKKIPPGRPCYLKNVFATSWIDK